MRNQLVISPYDMPLSACQSVLSNKAERKSWCWNTLKMLHRISRSELKLLKKEFAIRKGLNRFCISSVVLAERIDFSVLCTFQFLLQKILRVKRMLMEGIQIRTTAASLFTVSMAFLNESFVLLVWCLTERWSCATGLRKFVAKVSLSRSMTLGSSDLILSKVPNRLF